MPSKKEVQNLRYELIEESIFSLKKTKQKFDNITALAKAVAEIVTLKESIKWAENKDIFTSEPKKMAHQTLLTNKKYKNLLIEFFGKETINKNIDVNSPEIKALLLSKNIEISNLKEENSRLEMAVSNFYSQTPLKVQENELTNSNELENAYMVINSLIKEYGEFIDIDEENNKLINLVNMPTTEIIESSKLKGFFNFINKNKLR